MKKLDSDENQMDKSGAAINRAGINCAGINREVLLGYLMNALDDDESAHVARNLLRSPELRAELADLQQEISPLNAVYESVEPPAHLARRTCDAIWAAVDHEDDVAPSIPPPSVFLAVDAIRSTETLSASSRTVEVPVLESAARRLLRRDKRDKTACKQQAAQECLTRPSSRGRRVDILVSAAIGIVIAVIVFPTVNYTKNRVQQYFAQGKIQEINQRIDRFAQLQPGVVGATETTGPLDLSNFGWEELKPNEIPLLVVNAGSPTPQLGIATASEPRRDLSMASREEPSEGTAGGLVLGQTRRDGVRHDSMNNMPSVLSNVSLPNIGQILPVAAGSPLQTAYGQNVLFHNGRIFIRRAPPLSTSK